MCVWCVCVMVLLLNVIDVLCVSLCFALSDVFKKAVYVIVLVCAVLLLCN